MAEKWSLGRALRGVFVKPTIDETTWEDLETALLTADFGPDITERIVEELNEKVERYRTTDPRDLQRAEPGDLIPQRLNPERLQPVAQPIGRFGVQPAGAVVVITHHRRTTQRRWRQRSHDVERPIDLFVGVAGHEVAGDHDRIGPQLGDALERRNQELAIDDRPGVEVAQLHEPFADH